MKILSALLIITFVTFPVLADSKLEKLPEPLLQEGLNTIDVCMTIDAVAITRMGMVTADTEDEITDMKQSVQILLGSMTEEAKLGSAIMDVLSHNYNHTEDQIGKDLEELSKNTKAELEDQIKDVTTFAEFKDKFASRMLSCTDAIHSWVNKVKKNLNEPLDKND